MFYGLTTNPANNNVAILLIFLQSENGGERSEVGGAGEGEDEILAELQRKQAELKAVVS